MRRQAIATLGVCSTLIFSGSLAYAANDAPNAYVDPTARVEALVNAINQSNAEVNKQAQDVLADHKQWADNAALSSYSGWTKFKSFWPFLGLSMQMGINTIELGTNLSKMKFDNADQNMDEYHTIMKNMMTGSAQPMTYTTTKSLLGTIGKTQKVDLDTAKVRYYDGMAQAYAVPKKIIKAAGIAYTSTIKSVDNYQKFSESDCILAVNASRGTDLYQNILGSVNAFNKLLDNNKLLDSIKFLHDANVYMQFYYTADPAKVCSYKVATETLQSNQFMQAYMQGFERYKNLLSTFSKDLNVTNDHAYPVYAATAAIDFVTITETQSIIDALKKLKP
ncbi:hypothetical protein [Cysteiniphilum sp. JM-1]|uniref:hypothetical protein n=1 Tax=Cysteiniphilum sp. JM-1 TaxID=2610891 RepID=UPI001243ED64|nr:hypothetical protein [Cysteiniphilum sp. JM-1]